MDNIFTLIEFWKKNPSVRYLIHQGFSFPNSEEIRRGIKESPAQQRRETIRILKEVKRSLEKLKQSLNVEHQEIFDSIADAQRRRMAFLSYNKNSGYTGKR